MFFTAIIYADSLKPPVSNENTQKSVIFEVTGGIESFDKKESTFDETRIVSGVAEDGTDVEISVFTKDLKGNLNEKIFIILALANPEYSAKQLIFMLVKIY